MAPPLTRQKADPDLEGTSIGPFTQLSIAGSAGVFMVTKRPELFGPGHDGFRSAICRGADPPMRNQSARACLWFVHEEDPQLPGHGGDHGPVWKPRPICDSRELFHRAMIQANYAQPNPTFFGRIRQRPRSAIFNIPRAEIVMRAHGYTGLASVLVRCAHNLFTEFWPDFRAARSN